MIAAKQDAARAAGYRPARQRVAERVREMIRAQGLGPGDLLPTYQELGRLLGASYVTVKRGVDDLAAEGLVQRVASRGTFVTKELALMPHPLRRLGVICPGSRKSLFAASYLTEIMHGAMLGAPANATLHIFSLREDGLVDAAQLAEQHVDGVLLLGVENDDYLRMFARWGTPGVVADYTPQGVPLDSVACDNQAAARHVVSRLAALGHSRVAFAAFSPRSLVVDPHNPTATLLVRNSSDVRERQEESLRLLREQGFSVLELAPPKGLAEWSSHAALLAERVTARAGRPTAVVTADASAAARLTEEVQRRGVRVPEDLSVCAVAGDRDTFYRSPAIAHCRFDFFGMGRTAVTLLAARCLRPEAADPQRPRIGFEFVEGETLGRARRPRGRTGDRERAKAKTS